jgi:hypothetical protein
VQYDSLPEIILQDSGPRCVPRRRELPPPVCMLPAVSCLARLMGDSALLTMLAAAFARSQGGETRRRPGIVDLCWRSGRGWNTAMPLMPRTD